MKRKVIFNLETKEIDKRNRIITFIGSTDTVDRTGEIVTLDGWDLKNYKKNPVFLWAHRYGDPPIGKSLQTRIKKEEGLMFKIEFADRETYPFADTIFNLYEGGFLNAVSVGFIPQEIKYDEESDQLYITKKELLELSAVPVPANPEALTQGFDIKDMNEAVKKGCVNIQEAYEFMREADLWKKAYDKKIEPIEKEKKVEKDNPSIENKPYANEHSCRLVDPGKFDSFARKNCYAKSDGKCIDYIFGIKDGKSEVQAMRYDKEIWTEAAAKKHCKDHDGILFEPASGKTIVIPAKVMDQENFDPEIKEIKNHVNIYKEAFKSVGSAESEEFDEDLKAVKDMTDKLRR